MRSQIVLNYAGTGEITQSTSDKIYQGQVAGTEYTLNVTDKTWLQTDQIFISFTRPTSPATSKNFIMSPAGIGIWKWISNGWETDVTDSELGTSTTLKISFVNRRKSTVNPALYIEKTTAEYDIAIQPSSAYSPLVIDESDATTIINSLLAKVDRYDFADSGYAVDGYKADRAIYTDFSATINSVALTGSLLVFAVTADTIRTQSEYFFSGRDLYSRIITINGATITVGTWGEIAITQALLDRITKLEADNTTNKNHISTNTTDISIIKKSQQLCSNVYPWVYVSSHAASGELAYIGNVTVPDGITDDDIKKYNIWIDLSAMANLNSPTVDTKVYIGMNLKTESGTILFDSGSPNPLFFNYAGHDYQGYIVYPNKLSGGMGFSNPIQFINKNYTFVANAGPIFAENASAGYSGKRGFLSAEDKTKLDAIDMSTKADLVEGKVPTEQLPSYVDDVIEYANLAAFPVTGESGKIYIALDTNLSYRWSGSVYTEISPSIALGETSDTAYRGDRGKAAYDHSQITGNPHGSKATQILSEHAAINYTPETSYIAGHLAGIDTQLGKSITKTAQTLTTEEKTQARTNIGAIGGDSLSNYIAKDNTTEFVPSGDYNPATKKYADSVANAKEPLLPSTPADPTNKVLNGNKEWATINAQPKNLIFTDTPVLVTDWAADSTYVDYPYKATIALTGVTATDFAQVIPNLVDIVGANYAMTNLTYAGGVYIYAKVIPENTVTIPTIIITKGA